MSIEPLRSVRDHLSEFVDRVQNEHERIVLTRNGHAAAVLISPEDLAQLEETIDVLSDPAALADIREADEAYARGDVVRGVEATRQLRRRNPEGPGEYELVLTPPARRALTGKLPEPVATAVIEF